MRSSTRTCPITGRTPASRAPHATLVAAPGQRFHEVVAPEGHEDLPREELRAWAVRETVRLSVGE